MEAEGEAEAVFKFSWKRKAEEKVLRFHITDGDL